jgi:hypothetical protein
MSCVEVEVEEESDPINTSLLKRKLEGLYCLQEPETFSLPLKVLYS